MVLRYKYRKPFLDLSSPHQVGSSVATPDLAMPVSPLREPPPYRPPPPAPLSPSSPSVNNTQTGLEITVSNSSGRENSQNNDSSESYETMSSPPVPPRRKSQDKLKTENKENIDKNRGSSSEAVIKVRSFFIHIKHFLETLLQMLAIFIDIIVSHLWRNAEITCHVQLYTTCLKEMLKT